jgi:hypothetical protein
MAILTVHHWRDRRAGYSELCRVSPHRVVLTFDPQIHNQHWFLREYVPSVALFDEQHAPSIDEIADGVGASHVETVPIPHDCTDGFTAAYWRRPHAYLDPEVRRGHSGLAQADPTVPRFRFTRWDGGEGLGNRCGLEPGVAAGFGEGAIAAAAVVESEALELGSDVGTIGHEGAEAAVGVDRGHVSAPLLVR